MLQYEFFGLQSLMTYRSKVLLPYELLSIDGPPVEATMIGVLPPDEPEEVIDHSIFDRPSLGIK